MMDLAGPLKMRKYCTNCTVPLLDPTKPQCGPCIYIEGQIVIQGGGERQRWKDALMTRRWMNLLERKEGDNDA